MEFYNMKINTNKNLEINYVNCYVCGIPLDPTSEAVFENGRTYCFEHYEEFKQELQDMEFWTGESKNA
jgi:hypothetical protein